MTTETIAPDQGVMRLRELSENRIKFEAMQGYLCLPAPTTIVRPEGVFVSVTDPDDLLPWLEQLGGVVHRAAPFEGVELLSLVTFTPPSGGVRVPVRVSVAVPSGESLMWQILAAVSL